MKYLMFGSLNIDKVYTVPHFVSEGETLSSIDYTEYAGGKGLNQSIALAMTGVKVFHAGKIGKDGYFLKIYLKAAGINVDNVYDDASITGHAMIQVTNAGENCILLYGGANKEITVEQVDQVLAEFNSDDILVLQNEINCLEYIINIAHAKGLTIALNPSPINDVMKTLDYSKVDYLFLNEIEGQELTKQQNSKSILETLLFKYPNLKILLTLGAKGSIYKDCNQEFAQEIYKVDVVDTTAAGDTFMGYFLGVVFKTNDIPYALKIASKAASITVSRKGASQSIPKIEEVLDM